MLSVILAATLSLSSFSCPTGYKAKTSTMYSCTMSGTVFSAPTIQTACKQALQIGAINGGVGDYYSIEWIQLPTRTGAGTVTIKARPGPSDNLRKVARSFAVKVQKYTFPACVPR